jgi:hypothetical protein
MPHLCIPGGTSPGLGRSLVTALSVNLQNEITVLSRKTSQIPQWLLDLSHDSTRKKVEVVKVNYEDEEALVEVLDRVDVVSFESF